MNIYHWVFSSDKPPYASVWHSLSSIEKNKNIISWLSWFIVIFLTKKNTCVHTNRKVIDNEYRQKSRNSRTKRNRTLCIHMIHKEKENRWANKQKKRQKKPIRFVRRKKQGKDKWLLFMYSKKKTKRQLHIDS